MAARVWLNVEVFSHSIGLKAILLYHSTLKDTTSFEVTSLESDTVYNITVTPCNMAGYNESCDVHSVQTELGGEIRASVQTQVTGNEGEMVWMQGAIETERW